MDCSSATLVEGRDLSNLGEMTENLLMYDAKAVPGEQCRGFKWNKTFIRLQLQQQLLRKGSIVSDLVQSVAQRWQQQFHWNWIVG